MTPARSNYRPSSRPRKAGDGPGLPRGSVRAKASAPPVRP